MSSLENGTNTPETGAFLEYVSYGGNNHDAMFGSTHLITAGTIDQETGEEKRVRVIFDWGRNEVPGKFAGGQYDTVAPDLSKHIPMPGQNTPAEPAEAIILSHGHSDHVAGFEEYLEILEQERLKIEGIKQKETRTEKDELDIRNFEEMMQAVPPVYATPETIKQIKADMIKRVKLQALQEAGLRFGSEDLILSPGQEIAFGENGELKTKITQANHSVPGTVGIVFHNGEIAGMITGDTKTVDHTEVESFIGDKPMQIFVTDAAHRHKGGESSSDEDMFRRCQEFVTENAGKQLVFVLPSAHAVAQQVLADALIASGKNIVIDGGPKMATSIASFSRSKSEYASHLFTAGSEEADKLDPQKTVYFTTGLYGEEESPFVAAMNGENTSFLTRDAVVFASSYGKTDDIWEKFDDIVGKGKGRYPGVTILTARDIPEMGSRGHANGVEYDRICEENAQRGSTIIVCSHAEIAYEKKDKDGNVLQEYRDYYTEARDHLEEMGFRAPVVQNGTVIKATSNGVDIDRQEKVGWLATTHEHGPYDAKKTNKGAYKRDDNGELMLTRSTGKLKKFTIETDHGYSSGQKTESEKLNDQAVLEKRKKEEKIVKAKLEERIKQEELALQAKTAETQTQKLALSDQETQKNKQPLWLIPANSKRSGR